MSHPTPISLTYRYFRKGKYIFISTAVGVALFEFANLFRSDFGELKPLFEGHIWDFLKDMVGFYYLFELISVFLFFRLSLAYFRVFNLTELEPGWRNLLLYAIKCLPLILLSIFIFAPVTNTIRYLVYKYPEYSWADYFPEYFFHSEMYIRYLVPLFIFGYIYIFINAIEDFTGRQSDTAVNPKQQRSESRYLLSLIGHDNDGNYPIAVSDVWWFEVEDRTYCAYTEGRTYKISKTLNELESVLDPAKFFRINRSVIVNTSQILSYRYWENDKYVVKLKDHKTEFVIQRTRLKMLKSILNLRES